MYIYLMWFIVIHMMSKNMFLIYQAKINGTIIIIILSSIFTQNILITIDKVFKNKVI